ncbi:MAG: hypothetical protein ACYTXT_10360 [Nostoc sp.]
MNIGILKLTGCNSYNLSDAMPGFDVAMSTMVTELCRTTCLRQLAARTWKQGYAQRLVEKCGLRLR